MNKLAKICCSITKTAINAQNVLVTAQWSVVFVPQIALIDNRLSCFERIVFEEKYHENILQLVKSLTSLCSQNSESSIVTS